MLFAGQIEIHFLHFIQAFVDEKSSPIRCQLDLFLKYVSTFVLRFLGNL